jgi:hypothetical protein
MAQQAAQPGSAEAAVEDVNQAVSKLHAEVEVGHPPPVASTTATCNL